MVASLHPETLGRLGTPGGWPVDERRDGDVGGIAVHITARVMAAAASGQILTSRTVRDLVVAPTSSWTTLGRDR
jgi:class 3 adenylate cyclase